MARKGRRVVTDNDHRSEIETLKHAIAVLEEENAQLSERAEESLLLGLVAETIQQRTDPVDILECVLERVSILKNLPFTACGRLTGGRFYPLATYAAFSDDRDIGLPIQLSDSLQEALGNGPFVVGGQTELSADFKSTFHPTHSAVIPFTSHLIKDGVFIFMDGDAATDRLSPMLMVLDRIVDMTVSRMDNEHLMAELARLNRELEDRIDTRTRALVAANERFVTVLDGIDAHVYAAGLKTHEILFMNRKMKEDFGDNLIGKKCYREFRNETAPCSCCTNRRLIDDQGQPGPVVVTETQNPVTGRWYMNHDRAVVWVDGRLVKLQIATDITSLKHTEREKRQLQERLQQSQKMEAIGTLAGGIAHDFNNLLMGIQGRTSLILLDLASNDPHHEHLKSIEAYVQSATGLTRQLLGFARGGKYEPKPTDINRLVDDSANLFGRTKKEIRIHKKLPSDLWPVEVDRGQIQQVLLNLYVNAWQAMPSGGDLYLQSGNQRLNKADAKALQLPAGKYVSVTVADTGTGIDPSILPRIFDPFFTTKERGRGTGLGLAASYGIVHNHGGAIEASSTVGSGSTFTIYLPASAHAIIDEHPAEHRPTQGSGSILLVDDEPMIVDVGRMMLEKIGYSVITAVSGGEALAAYRKRPTDIVILDMIMPDMGGGDVFDRLKELDPDVKVMLSSGYSLSGQTQEVFERGCIGFIQKPFTLDDLSQKVKMAMQRSRHR